MVITINPEKTARDVIVLGASAGGIRAVMEVLSRLPADLPAFVGVVIHRGARSDSDWSSLFVAKSEMRVIEPSPDEPLINGVVYVAPSDRHMTFGQGKVALNEGAKRHHTRPAVDPLFESAAIAYGPRVVGVVLTGAGHDGLQGLLQVALEGGIALVQSPSQAEHASMPLYAIAHDHVKAVLSLDDIGDTLVQLARGGAVRVT